MVQPLPPPDIFRLFLKSEGKEIKWKGYGGGGGGVKIFSNGIEKFSVGDEKL